MANGEPFRKNKIILSVHGTSPCPCGSGKTANECLAVSGDNHPASVSPRVDAIRSGLSVARCYAAHLNDCGGGLSREHYMSAGILRRVNEASSLYPNSPHQPLRLEVEGRLEAKSLPPAAVAAKVLCQRHNQALSGLDDVGLRLFDALSYSGAQVPVEHRIYLFNGLDVERWLLKLLCGTVASGILSHSDASPSRIVAPEWVESLFGIRELSPSQGFFVRAEDFHSSGPERGFEFGFLSERQSRAVCGIRLVLSSIELLFVIANTALEPDILMVEDMMLSHRPPALLFRTPENRIDVYFKWPSSTRTPPILVERS